MNLLMNPVGSKAEEKLNCINAVVITHERNLFCLPRQERFFHAFRGKIALNIGKYR